MSQTRKEDLSQKLERCKQYSFFQQQIATEQCRSVPNQESSYYPAKAFQLLHKDFQKCLSASAKAIEQYEQCNKLIEELDNLENLSPTLAKR